jgi:hypothetical protein
MQQVCEGVRAKEAGRCLEWRHRGRPPAVHRIVLSSHPQSAPVRKATFFIPGMATERYPAMVEAVLGAGHEAAPLARSLSDPARGLLRDLQ